MLTSVAVVGVHIECKAVQLDVVAARSTMFVYSATFGHEWPDMKNDQAEWPTEVIPSSHWCPILISIFFDLFSAAASH